MCPLARLIIVPRTGIGFGVFFILLVENVSSFRFLSSLFIKRRFERGRVVLAQKTEKRREKRNEGEGIEKKERKKKNERKVGGEYVFFF